jgi:hypothetical protein
MRNLAIAAFVCTTSVAWAADSVEITAPIHLDTPEQLANLLATNPDHYARAQRIIAAANTLCHPGQPKSQHAGLDSRDVSCGHLFLTSNPPKREVTFTLDRIPYVALVPVTVDPPHPTKAE